MDRSETGLEQGLQEKKGRRILLYIATIIFSVLFLFIGNRIATKDLTLFDSEAYGETVVKAKVELITGRILDDYVHDESTDAYKNVQINFDAIILSGEERGERVKGSQIIDNMFNYGMPEVERGDKVLLVKYKGQEDMEWQMMEFLRTDKLIILGLLFVLAL